MGMNILNDFHTIELAYLFDSLCYCIYAIIDGIISDKKKGRFNGMFSTIKRLVIDSLLTVFIFFFKAGPLLIYHYGYYKEFDKNIFLFFIFIGYSILMVILFIADILALISKITNIEDIDEDTVTNFFYTIIPLGIFGTILYLIYEGLGYGGLLFVAAFFAVPLLIVAILKGITETVASGVNYTVRESLKSSGVSNKTATTIGNIAGGLAAATVAHTAISTARDVMSDMKHSTSNSTYVDNSDTYYNSGNTYYDNSSAYYDNGSTYIDNSSTYIDNSAGYIASGTAGTDFIDSSFHQYTPGSNGYSDASLMSLATVDYSSGAQAFYDPNGMPQFIVNYDGYIYDNAQHIIGQVKDSMTFGNGARDIVDSTGNTLMTIVGGAAGSQVICNGKMVGSIQNGILKDMHGHILAQESNGMLYGNLIGGQSLGFVKKL